MTILHHNDKACYFIHIPRTGGEYVTSLFNESDRGEEYKLFLNENERLGGIVLEHLHYPLYNWYFNLEKIPHITIVREPWEKFKRKTLTPARIMARRISAESEAGPTVATIFVRRIVDS